MHLQTRVVAIIFAAAAGAAAGRATAPHSTSPPAAGISPLSRGHPEWAEGDAHRTASLRASFAPEAHDADGSGARSRAAGEAGSQTAVVYVAGAVAKPGVYALRPAARADDALRAAGGPTLPADLVAINLAARIEDGEEIVVPVRGAETSAPSGTANPGTKHARKHSRKRGRHRKRIKRSDDATDTADAPTEAVDVNAADEATLETLPGVGPSLAQRIVAFRDLNGSFASSDELLDVGGMTPGKLDAIAPYVTFHEAR